MALLGAAPLAAALLAATLTACSFQGAVSQRPGGAGTPTGSTSGSQVTTSPAGAASSPGHPTASPGTPSGTPGRSGSRPVTSGTTSAGSSGGSTAACRTTSLRITLGRPEGAAGTQSVSMDFVNVGPAACVLSGYPGVSFVDRNGRQVGAAARHGTAGTRLTLRPAGQAHTNLQITNYQNYDATECKPVPVRGYRVYPPNETESTIVDEPGRTACSGAAIHQLDVDAVQAGPGSPGP